MSSTSPAVQRWLRERVDSVYNRNNHVYTHIDSALAQFSTLRPKSDVYTYDDGRTQLLLCIHGLLPIKYRNASYNIPIAIWIPIEYPRQPPIPYVVPTSDMLIKQGRQIDLSGKCNIDYTSAWTRKPEAHSIVGLIDALRDQFSLDPPVYAKPAPRPAPPPLPPQYQSQQQQHPQQQQTATTSPPPRPPPLPQSTSPPTSPPRPPLPPHLQPSPPPPLPPHIVSPPPIPAHVYSPPPPPLPPSIHATPSPPGPPPPPPPQFYHPTPPPPPQPVVQPAQPVLPPVDYLDAEDDQSQVVVPSPANNALPPRPPNPELLRLHAQVHDKITSELASLSHALALDAERLRAHQSDLLTGEPAIRDEMARLEAVRDVSRNVAARIGAAVNDAEANIAELRKKGDPEVDELICSTTIVYNQLLTLVAEDNAIEDTIYHLHRALNAGRIDLDRFLKSTRLLAEEQFMKRALIEKIHAAIPLGMWKPSAWS